jgi:midasin
VVFNVQRAYSLHLAADLDNVSTAFRLDLLHDATQQSSVAVVGADFYLDSQPAQIRKMHDPILAMQKRASELAEEWPEQMILVEISERCEALLQLPVVTPIARVLTYLESFLPKIEDWERYSSSQTTLRPLQSNIVALIVEWRRLELSSWARLLDREEQQYAQRMADWWFRFYETLIRSAITLESDASTTQSTSTFLNNIVGVLQTFFDSSPVGHFSRRLDLVRSFARLASEMSNEGYPLLSRISALLYNIFEFYRRKGQEIIAYLGTERKRLAKDLQDVIRLASWRDVNVDALKASAQKSHRQLYKTIRKFRAILDKPAQPFLTASNSASVDNKDDTQSIIHTKAPASLLVPVNETPSDLPSGTPSAIIHLDQTVKRLNSVLAEKEKSTSSSPGQAVDDLRSIIIQRSSALRDEQPKGATKEEKAKYVNALTNRKRKAWSDLLKELKRIGLSPRPSERTLSKQTDSTNLYGSPPLLYRAKDSFLPMEHLEGADALFYGILSRFPAIRGVPANHHDDISSAQFLSAVGSLQSSFAVVLDDRSRLERTMFRFSRLQQRSHFLEEFANIGLASSQQQDSASTLHELLQRNRKLADALSEVIAASSRHRSLMDDKNDHASVEHLGRALAQALNNMNESNHDLQRLYESASATSLLSKSDEAAVGKAEVLWQSSSDLLKQLVRLMPRLAYLLEPVDQWMTAQVLPQKLYTVSAVASAEEEYVKLVSSILNVFQAVSGRPEVPVLGDDGDISDLAVSKASKHLRETVAALYLEEVDEQMSRFCRACAQADAYQREALISRYVPYPLLKQGLADLIIPCQWSSHCSSVSYSRPATPRRLLRLASCSAQAMPYSRRPGPDASPGRFL